MAHKFLVVIGGPTGMGKSEVAIQVARHFHTEIVNADSRQVYREMNIGVGKPTAEEMREIPHHLIGHISIHENYSAGQFAEDALHCFHALFQNHDIVVICGGTGLYIKAVIEGMDDFPDIPDEVTAKWTSHWHREGIGMLQTQLERLDPDYFIQVDKDNPMRLIRALAVCDYTGKTYSSFRSGQSSARPFQIIPLLLERSRDELYERINQRVLDMIASGWLQEAESLFPYRHLKALQTVGYKELFDVLDGNLKLEEAVTLIQQSTRRYAKRQLTWFRNQGEWHSFHPADVPALIGLIKQKIKSG